MPDKTAEPKPENGCKEGYTPVWKWCFKTTVIDKLSEPLEEIKVPSFTDPGCEAVVAALKQLQNSIEAALEAPEKYMKMLKKLVDYPFNVAENMVDTALGALDQVDKAIESLLGGVTGPLDKLKSAMEHILDCPFLEDTEVGKLAASIIDAIDSDLPFEGFLSDLKESLSSTAKEALENAKDTPTEAINNIQKAYDSALKRAGIDSLIDNMKKIEECIDSLCSAYKDSKDFIDRLPKSADSLLEKAGATWDKATGTVKRVATTTTTDVQKQAQKVADDIDSLSHLRW